MMVSHSDLPLSSHMHRSLYLSNMHCKLHLSAVLDRFQLRERLELLMNDVDVNDLDHLANIGRQARLMIMNAGLPDEVAKQIEDAYTAMSDSCASHSCSVAVRSSATAEDLPTASFAGQQASFLNVVGKHSVCNVSMLLQA